MRNGTATVHARLVDAAGATLGEQAATMEPSGSPSQLRATGLLLTDRIAPGAYTIVVEARQRSQGSDRARMRSRLRWPPLARPLRDRDTGRHAPHGR